MDNVKEKVDDILAATKISEILRKKDSDDRKPTRTLLWVLAILGAVAAIAAIAFAVYRYMTPSYVDDFDDDDFDDDFEDADLEDAPAPKKDDDEEA